jgi:membrane protease YdiL (CAAX protease family)
MDEHAGDKPAPTTQKNHTYPAWHWTLGLIALSLWAFFGWITYRADGSMQKSRLFRMEMEKQLLAYEGYLIRAPNLPRWFRNIVGMDDFPVAFVEAYRSGSRGLPDMDHVHLELAIVCQRFYSLDLDRRWLDEAKRELDSVSDIAKSGLYFIATERILTEDEKLQFADYATRWSQDWWICQLAAKQNITSQFDVAGLQKRSEFAWRNCSRLIVLHLLIIVFGVCFFIGSTRALGPCYKPSSGTYSLIRRWNLPLVLFYYSLSGLLIIALVPLIEFLNAFLTDFSLKHGWNFLISGGFLPWLWLAISVAAIMAQPLIVASRFVPNLARLRKTLGFTQQDFKSKSFWMFGLTATGVLLLLFWILDWIVQPEYNGTNHSSSFLGYGAFALPIELFWGVLLAPVVEEVLYRGFIFRATQQVWGTLAGMVISSLIFAYSHHYPAFESLQVFCFGMFFAWVYHRTGKLAACMILHGFVNLLLTFSNWMMTF